MQLYVATNGNDNWSGHLPAPNADSTDGPLLTLNIARDRVRALKESGRLDGAMTVSLRGGVYPLEETLCFTAADSGPISYVAYPGETPILDGGTRITCWEMGEVNGKRCWVAEIPAVRSGKWHFLSLFVNGERRRRPRLPKEGFYRIADTEGRSFRDGTNTFRCTPGDIQPWRNLTDVEVVVLHLWVDEHMPIASFDAATNTLTSTRTSIFGLLEDGRDLFARYYVENVFEALSEPGEWYLDRPSGKLYYLPMPGEEPETAEVYAPHLTQLLSWPAKPEEAQYVDYLRFEGLTFRHSEAIRPPGKGRSLHLAGLLQRHRICLRPAGGEPCARRAHFRGRPLLCAGGVHPGAPGLVRAGTGKRQRRQPGHRQHHRRYRRRRVAHQRRRRPRPENCRTGHNRITDNHIHHIGRVFHQATGIFCKHTYGNLVAHNHIHDGYYSGISCGWVWGYADSASKDNHFIKNHIHHLGFAWLSDMGGIYTLGVSPGTVLRGNLIHDVVRASYGGWAIYLDEGSSHIIVENNINYNTTSESFHIHYGRENIVRNNIFAFATDGLVALNRAEDHQAFTFERNLLITHGSPVYSGGYACRLDDPHFSADLNLLWQTDGAAPTSRNSGGEGTNTPNATRLTLAQMQALGYDRHSLVANPQCANLEARDFTLAADSPAFALGFKAIDMSDVGIRAKEQREEVVGGE